MQNSLKLFSDVLVDTQSLSKLKPEHTLEGFFELYRVIKYNDTHCACINISFLLNHLPTSYVHPCYILFSAAIFSHRIFNECNIVHVEYDAWLMKEEITKNRRTKIKNEMNKTRIALKS